jgi:hypothetical protein
LKKILLLHPIHWFGGVVDRVQKKNPEVMVTPNFEQVLAMVRTNEVERVCIMFSTLTETLPSAVRKLHEANPNLPVQIWNSGEEPKSISTNEEYLNTEDYSFENFYTAIDHFYQRG